MEESNAMPTSQTTQIKPGALKSMISGSMGPTSSQPLKTAQLSANQILKAENSERRQGILTKTSVKPIRKRHGSQDPPSTTLTKQGPGRQLPHLIQDKDGSRQIKRLRSQGHGVDNSFEDQDGMTKADPNQSKYNSQIQLMDQKPFDFQKVKVIIKRGKLGDQEVMLDKKWTLDNIEHFRPVIEGVSDDEGIEITLTCNLEAFQFIIRFLQETNYDKKCEMVNEINH